MNLFLASEAKNPATIKKLDEYVDGLSGKKIAYIPTAANGEGWGSWKEGGSWGLVNTLKAEITLLQLEDFSHEEVKEKLQNRDIVWVAGGLCGYLMYWMRRRRLDEYLPEILEKGTLYVGSSAGSMVTGHTLDISEWYGTDQEFGAHFIPGLGLVDFDIYPHFEEGQLGEIRKNYKGNKLYLLKNGEEIIFEDGKVTVIGEERILNS